MGMEDGGVDKSYGPDRWVRGRCWWWDTRHRQDRTRKITTKIVGQKYGGEKTRTKITHDEEVP